MHLGEATFETCSGDRRSRLAMPVPKDRLIPDWVEGAGRFPTEGEGGGPCRRYRWRSFRGTASGPRW